MPVVDYKAYGTRRIVVAPAHADRSKWKIWTIGLIALSFLLLVQSEEGGISWMTGALSGRFMESGGMNRNCVSPTRDLTDAGNEWV